MSIALVLLVSVAVFNLLPTADLGSARSSPPEPATAGADGYVAPVDAPVVDPFRPPPEPWMAGNRGVEYATVPGTQVGAAGEGVVVFAGEVARTRFVTVLHPDGLRTTYGLLASIDVVEGQEVARRGPLGTTGDRLHFSVRDGEEYLDPAVLLAGGVVIRAHLVPHDPPLERPAEEARALTLLVAGGLGSRPSAWGAAGSLLRAAPALIGPGADPWDHYFMEMTPAPHLLRVLGRTGDWMVDSENCRGGDQPVEPPAGRRILVAVGGFGSSGPSAAVDDVDHRALGYADADVVRFSYAGGHVPGTGVGLELDGGSSYAPADSWGDLHESGRLLADLLVAIAAAAPGVPIDVIAHSQGGVVARLALAALADSSALPPAVDVLVTLGSPHQGTDLATALVAVQSTDAGAAAVALLDAVADVPGDPDAPAVHQLAETSELIAGLRGLEPPEGVRALSVAARGDLVVPASHTPLAGADDVTLPIVGPDAHSALPGNPATTRAVARHLAGLPPMCQTLADALLDASTAELLTTGQDAMGIAAGVLAVALS